MAKTGRRSRSSSEPDLGPRFDLTHRSSSSTSRRPQVWISTNISSISKHSLLVTTQMTENEKSNWNRNPSQSPSRRTSSLRMYRLQCRKISSSNATSTTDPTFRRKGGGYPPISTRTRPILLRTRMTWPPSPSSRISSIA